jgi:hypothetical protein
MCCSHDHGRGVQHHGGYCCSSYGHFHRRFLSKEEKVARLETYLQDLKTEAKVVEEQIKELKGD